MKSWHRIGLACLGGWLLGLAQPGVTAPPPKSAPTTSLSVTSAMPGSAYQGQTLDVIVGGSGFNSSARANYYVTNTTDPGGVTVLKVTYQSSSQLLTTIRVDKAADLSKFDIVVTLDDGRKGKGTTLFKVQAPPTYPANRAWHAFKSNGGTVVEASRLFMYGGGGSDAQVVPPDLWYYSAYSDRWTLVMPAGTARPGLRQHTGLSCGGGACVMEDGSSGFGLVDETWVYIEATNAWVQATCRRTIPCPSARMMETMAFDPQSGNHLLFGGRGSQAGLNDTWTFDVAALKWTLRAPTFKPTERNRAAALQVPGIGVVMHGGQPYNARAALCDMYAWNGTNWRPIQFDTAQPYPCLHSHDVAWDGASLIVTGGYVDTSDTPSGVLWRFTFAADGQSGTWSRTTSQGTCNQVLGTDDPVIHPGARMAYDVPTQTRVWFGGEANGINGVIRYGNTVECY